MPRTRAAENSLGDRATFLAISMGDSIDNVRQYAQQADAPGITFLLDSDRQVMQAYRVLARPYLVALDPQGRIRWTRIGRADTSEIVQVLETLAQFQ
ncbi:MAG: redoxin domain-containing protein [Deinococcus sp.]|nr:redoxin domain-containing protein [Deinococcus sp.]